MIHIRRPFEYPASLKRWGEQQTRIDCDAYDACPGDYQSGAKTFPPKKYYSAKAVKALLVEIHYSKCCYCEKKFTPSNLHVEHYRPKSRVRQTLDQKETLGYYWLAYRWDNLLLSCHDCNNLCKGTRFPLANPKKRARSHNDPLGEEHPLFIDPSGKNPRKHIRFDGDIPWAPRRNRQGLMTIDVLRLRRTELTEDRLKMIDNINVRLALVAGAEKNPDDHELQAAAMKARQFLKAAKRQDAEFSSMVTDYLAGFRF